MSQLTAYRRYAPFTADRLIDAANAILASNGSAPMTKRTLRFYTAQNVVPRPMGSPKFARYGYDHLLTLLSARALQDQGHKLEQIVNEVSEIRRGQLSRLEKLVEDWLTHTRHMPSMVAEPSGEYDASPVFTAGTPTRRLQLTPNVTLDVVATVDMKRELEAASEAIRGILKEAASL